MEQNKNSFAPEAAADEHASFVQPIDAAPLDAPELHFASQGEQDAYWRGLLAGLRDAGREPAHPHMPVDFDLDLTRNGASSLISGKLLEAAPPDDALCPARPAAARHDGFTADKKRIFLATLAACGVVADACRMARISRVAAYDFRNKAQGRAFALAWDAALLIARSRMSDEVASRAMCGVVDRVYRDGELVAERHRYDNRLTMAVLTRLDRQAEGLGEGAATARIIAQEWDQFLDIVEQGGGGAESFLRARAPLRPVPAGTATGGTARCAPAEDVESAVAALQRLQAYRRFAAGLPQEIATDDLDPARMEDWSGEQWARAEFSGLLDRLEPSAWPEAARFGGAAGTNGGCKLRKAYAARHPDRAADGGGAEDDYAGCDVWEEQPDDWRTSFPPPDDFQGHEQGDPGEDHYVRGLTEEELQAIGADPQTLADLRAERIAGREAARLRFFGFDGVTPPPEQDIDPG